MRLQRVGLLCEGGKRYAYWCMLFMSYSLFYFSKSHFTLSLFSLLSLSILCLDCLSYYPCSFYGNCSYLCAKSSLCNFSFTLIAYQPFVSTANTLQSHPLPFLPYGFNLHYLWACVMFSLSSTTYFTTNSQPCHFAMYLSLPFEW